MKRYFTLKNFTLFLLLTAVFFTVYAKFLYQPEPWVLPKGLDEKFDEDLTRINSPEKLDSLTKGKFESLKYDTAKTLLFIDDFMRNRFYHSYSELTIKDNWIAFLSGKYVWSHFLNPVVPEDILKHPMAGCSQQGILFQDQLNRLKIPCGSIQFYPLEYQTSGHYAVTAYYDNSWHFFDSNLEPIVVDSTMPSIESIIERKLYPQMYTRKIHDDFKEYFVNRNYKRVMEKPFSRGEMFYFQSITKILSNWGWLILLTLYLIFRFRKTR